MCFKGLKGLKKHKNFFKHNISIVIIEKRMNRAKDYNAFFMKIIRKHQILQIYVEVAVL